MNNYITNFLEYLEITRGLSRRTIENYHFFLKRFSEFAENNNIANPKSISKDLIQKYRLYLNRLEKPDKANLKKNTQNYHLIALRAFLKYLAKNDIQSLEPEKIELARQEMRQVDFLNSEELKKILVAPESIQQSILVKLRDKAILEFLFSTGLRVSEVARFQRQDLNLKNLSLSEVSELTVRGKGGKLRVIFFSPSAKQAIKNYLDTRQDISPALFIRHGVQKIVSDEPLTSRSIERIVQKYAKIAGLTKKVTPHTFRHSYATDLLSNGADIRNVQALLGHASITTTQVYTHVTDKQLKDVYKKFHST